jgi:hypothetical protein
MKRLMLVSIVVAFMAAPAMADLVTVTANPLWTDTGIDVAIGDVITVTPVAGEKWCTIGGGVMWGPDGSDYNRDDLFLSYDSGAQHSAMIGYIGGDPYQGHWGDDSFFPQAAGYVAVNNGVTFTSSASGSLWLGVNDDARTMAIGDNSGSIGADVDVVPVPGAVLLGVLGLGMAGWKLRKRA